MVCVRCKMLVESELKKLGLEYKYVQIGEAEVDDNISSEKLERLNVRLRKSGLGLIDGKRDILVEKIKNTIIEQVHYSNENLKINLSDYLSKKLNYDYNYLAKVFSYHQGMTIEKFYIRHKIEKAKELILYDELNLKEIANKLQYSSVAHLAGQFKKITGVTPADYRILKNKNRIVLENV